MWLVLACTGPESKSGDRFPGLYDTDPLNPFPSAELMEERHVAIPEGALAVPEGGTPLDVRRVNWRSGFSPVQPAILRAGIPLDPESVGGEAVLGVGGPVRLYDLDSGEEIPCFAELDAAPEAVASGDRTLIVRPMATMTPGNDVAVVITSAVRTDAGASFPTGAWEAAQQDEHYRALADTLAGMGVTDIAFAWDFPVGTGWDVLDTAIAALETPAAWVLEPVTRALPEGVLAVAEGTFTAGNWLHEDRTFAVDSAGQPTPNGVAEMALYAWLPDSMEDGVDDGNPMPVVLFGHGILEDPAHYFEDSEDASAVIDLANRLEAIVIATVWRGLTRDDLVEAVLVANDFGTFPELTDRMVQGVLNTLSLASLAADGGLLDDPFFGGRADRTRLLYYGISLGSIEGAVVLANQDRIDEAVLHVGGSDWSTMLERSSNWPAFEAAVVRTIPDPGDRQVLYAVSQLLWDPVDPAVYATRLAGRPFLWQEAIGDNQVPNLTTELLMRSAGVPLATPGFSSPFGVDTTAMGTVAPAFVQFDPQLGLPAAENRPAVDTGAHNVPRTWEGCIQQTVTYFETGAVENYCGATGCDAEHTGG